MIEDFPADVRQFISQNIDSLAQLELLLLLRSQKERAWPVAEIAKHLCISSVMSEAILSALNQLGFVNQSDQSFQYQVTDADQEQLIGKLAETYRERRVAVTTEIYSKPANRLKTFAEAFRLRGD